MVREGIALIELIIAIVVMAIVFLAVPSIMEMAQKSSEVSLKQEALLLAASQMDIVSQMQWDENNTLDEGYAKILDVQDNSDASSGSAYARYPDTNSTYRVGGKTMNAETGQYRRKFHDQLTFASTTLGVDSGEDDSSKYDDIDDFNGFHYTNTIGAQDYKIVYNVDVTVTYHNNSISNNANPSGTSNVKMVEVHVHEAQNDTDIKIKTFFCNIGETKILIKPIP